MSFFVLVIGAAHAIPVLLTASSGPSAKLLVAVVMSFVGAFTGSDGYVLIDLLFVWSAYWLVSQVPAAAAPTPAEPPVPPVPQPPALPTSGDAWRLVRNGNQAEWVEVPNNSKRSARTSWVTWFWLAVAAAGTLAYCNEPTHQSQSVLQAPTTEKAAPHITKPQQGSGAAAPSGKNTGRDRRHCLQLGTNEAISKCAEP